MVITNRISVFMLILTAALETIYHNFFKKKIEKYFRINIFIQIHTNFLVELVFNVDNQLRKNHTKSAGNTIMMS